VVQALLEMALRQLEMLVVQAVLVVVVVVVVHQAAAQAAMEYFIFSTRMEQL